MSRVIGIDLGTTNSVVAILENGRPEVIQNPEGGKTTPSIVHLKESGEILVGDLARRQLLTEPKRTIQSIKRFMGCRADEAAVRMAGVHYDVVADAKGVAAVQIAGGIYRPEDISAEILRKMKESAEAFLGEKVSHAVITTPAHFNDSQRQATKLAAEKAGLKALRILNEPTAAALAYGLNRRERQTVAIFDFGGGTFDITILEIDQDIFEVKSTGGDTFLGGDNINEILTQWIIGQVAEKTGIDPSADLQACQRIAEAAEKIKCELSSTTQTVVSLPFLVSDESGPKHFECEITREQFEEMILSILERLGDACEATLADANMKAEDVTSVVLVGGSTRIPIVREMVREIFDQEPDLSLNPEEVVACGAAIQAAIMNGELDELLLLDVTPLSLGIELAGNMFSTIIARNSNVPVSAKKKFTTVVDNQDTVKVHVLQGERKIASENRSLAHLRLCDIPPAPKEIPEIEVTFHIDANGILTVSAVDLTSGSSEEIDVESFTSVIESEADRIVEEANVHAEEDRVFMQKSAVRQRLSEMEHKLKALRLANKEAVISGELMDKVKEAFFKLDVALNQDDWETVEEAERTARSVFVEITALIAIQNNPDSVNQDVVDITDSIGSSELPQSKPS